MRNVRSIRWLLLAFLVLAIPAVSFAQVSVGISVRIGPPPLPVYAQPICPGPRYIWTPGYWAYGPYGYYWVPGTWVLAPQVGFLWTPGYWGWGDGVYLWHGGYWGPRVGFYGGIDYGFGYGGDGYEGGYWRGRHFYYNRTVNNINVTVIHNTYNRTVIYNHENRVSYNGPGGINARPTREDMQAAREQHIAATREQTRNEFAARNNRAQWASVNHGRPAVAATPRPGEFRGRGVVPASRAGGPYRGQQNRNFARPQQYNGRPQQHGRPQQNGRPQRNNARPQNRRPPPKQSHPRKPGGNGRRR